MATGYEIFLQTPNATSGINRTNFHLRQVLPAASVAAATAGSGLARVTILTGSTSVSATLDSAWIGEAGATEPNFDGNQRQLRFNGATSAGPFTGVNTIVSDPVQFAYNEALKLVISMHWSGTDFRSQFLNSGPSGANFYGVGIADTQTGDTTPSTALPLLLSNQTMIFTVEMVPPSVGWQQPAPYVPEVHKVRRHGELSPSLTFFLSPASNIGLDPFVSGAFYINFIQGASCPPGQQWQWNDAQWGCGIWADTTSRLYGSLLDDRPIVRDYRTTLTASIAPLPPLSTVAPPPPVTVFFAPWGEVPNAPSYRTALGSTSASVSVFPPPQARLFQSLIEQPPRAPDYRAALASTTSPVAPIFRVTPVIPGPSQSRMRPGYRVPLASTTSPVFPLLPPPPAATTPLTWFDECLDDPLPQARDYRQSLASTTYPAGPKLITVQTPSRWIESSLGHLPIARDYRRALAQASIVAPIFIPPPVPTPAALFNPPIQPQRMARDYSAALASTSGVVKVPSPFGLPIPPPPPPICYTTFIPGGAPGITTLTGGSAKATVAFAGTAAAASIVIPKGVAGVATAFPGGGVKATVTLAPNPKCP